MHMQCLKHWMQLKDLYKLAKQIKNLLNIRYTCSDWFIAIFYCSQIDNKTTNRIHYISWHCHRRRWNCGRTGTQRKTKLRVHQHGETSINDPVNSSLICAMFMLMRWMVLLKRGIAFKVSIKLMVKPHLFQLASTSYLSTSYMLPLVTAIYAQIPELICI